MSDPGLQIVGLDKSFSGQTVVSGMSLEQTRGEIVCLLGPSGCGKTTALRMVAGLERPDRGTIHIGGRRVFGDGSDLPPEKRNVGLVFQSYAVWPHRTVLENIAYPLTLKKTPRAEQLATEALALVKLDGLRDRFPHTLSGGQQQRVALARALAAKPELLLFDEPLSNLDAKLREQMRHEVRELVRSVGITSLYVTHDQEEAFAVSDRVAVVLGGRIAQIAAPEVIYREPSTLEVAELVGRISRLEGVERSGERAVRISGATCTEASFTASASEGPLIAAARPEDLAVGGEGIDGEIVRSTFLGDRREITVKTSAGLLRVDADGSRGYTAGEHVRITILRCRVFGATSAFRGG
jgi:ABC-type Fe3+/spermidine/putrescine transport system ATPase subunit